MPASQRQRSASRKRRDTANSIAAAERAGHICEHCDRFQDRTSGQNHHDYRKNNHPELRHDPRNHNFLCHECHRLCHDNTIQGHIDMHAIRQRRGDDLELHPTAKGEDQ